jgi:hypothetical protein
VSGIELYQKLRAGGLDTPAILLVQDAIEKARPPK